LLKTVNSPFISPKFKKSPPTTFFEGLFFIRFLVSRRMIKFDGTHFRINMFWQQVVNAIWLGAVYSLFALGYTLIFGVLGILNLAHPSLYMWGAFIGLMLVNVLHLPIWLALPAAMIFSGLLSVGLDRIAFKPLRQRNAPHLTTLISSVGASMILINTAQGVFGAQTSRFQANTFPVHVFNIGPVSITLLQLTILGISLLIMLVLRWLLMNTRQGQAMRAVAYNTITAARLGIPVDKVIMETFFIAGALAGAAGVLLGLAFNNVSPFIGVSMNLKGLTVIVLGGLGNIEGAVLGGFVLAFSEVMSVAYLSSDMRDAVSFILLLIILLARPNGLLGRSSVKRA
jgi:branched-chain amino acid transport system permease protein